MEYLTKSDNVELKNIINDLVNKISAFLKINIFSGVVNKVIKENYNKGIDLAEEQFNMNFIPDNNKVLFLEKYTFDNIKGMNDEIAEKLRKELSQGLINMESMSQLKSRITKVMDVAEDRARMIARTETVRANNQGQLDGAKQSGLKLMKKWDAHLDSRTSEVCKYLNGKMVSLNAKFKWKDQVFDAPPAHPNCFLKNTKITTKNGKKNIQDIKIGDNVLTHKNRYKKVYNTIQSETDEYYEVEIGSGINKIKLKVTGEHPVLTQRGWVEIKNLTLNDYMVRLK